MLKMRPHIHTQCKSTTQHNTAKTQNASPIESVLAVLYRVVDILCNTSLLVLHFHNFRLFQRNNTYNSKFMGGGAAGLVLPCPPEFANKQ